MSVMSPSLSNDSTFRPTLLSDYFFRDDDDDESMYPEEHHNNGSMSCRSTSCHAMDCDRSPSSRGGDRDSSNVSTPTTTSPTLGMPPPPQTYASPVKTVLTPTGDTEEYVGPFKLGPVLGVGCTGTVRLGVHKDTGFEAAFKIIEKKYLNTDPKLWKKVKREIVILKVIEHPHVLKLYDVLETVNRLYLVLEHVRGGELFDYIVSRGRLERYEALKLTAQIVQGLEHCHAHSICHRDLKPENLLLDENHNIKIADFGMAQLMKKDNMRKTSCGSPHYASPEVIEGGAYDAKLADIWSIGVILYALLTGSLPFDHDSIPILLAMVSRGQYTIPSQVPADCADLIRRMLVVDPTKRITLSQIRHHPCYRGTDFFPPETPQSVTNAAAAAATVAALGTTTPSPPSSGSSSPATASTPGSQLQARRSLKLDTQEVDERVLLDLESLGLGWGTRDELRRKISLFAKRRSQADSSSSQEEEEPPIEHVFYQRLLQRRMDRLAELSRLSPKPRPRSIGARASSSLSISTSSANSITLPPAAATPPLQRSFTDGAHMQPHHEHESFSPLTSPTNTSAQPVTYQPSQSTSHHHHRKHHSVQAASAPQGPTTASHHPSPLSLPVPPPLTQNSTSPLASPSSGGTMPPFHQLLSPMATPMCSPPMSPTVATPFSELPSPAASITTHHEHHISISANSTSTSTSTSAPPSASTSAPSSCKQSSRRLFSSGGSTSSTNAVDTNTSLVSRAIQNKRISIPSVTNPLISPRSDLAAKGLTNVVVPSPTSKATPTYMESPRFHRKKLRQQPDSIDQSSVKKSWFSAIFSARPSMNIMSTLTGRKPLTPRSQAAAIAASTTSSTPSPPTLNTTLASHVVNVPPQPHKSTPSVSPPVPLVTMPSPSSPTARHHDLSSTLYSDKSIPSLIDQLKHVFSELHLNYITKSKYVFDVENHIHSNISTPGMGTSPTGSQRSIHSSQPSSASSSAVMSTATTPVASTRPRLSSTDLTIAIHEENEETTSSNHLAPFPRRRSSGADVTTNHSPTSHAVNALAGGIDAIRISLGEPAMALSPHAGHHARLTIQLCEPTSTSPASIQFISRQGEPQAVRALQYAIQKALNL